MIRRTVSGLVCVVATGLMLAGCGNSQGVTTASILGGSAEAAGTEQKPAKPEDRAVQVAAVSARAAKCGYNFDARRLKANYLASEQSTGVQGLQLTQIDQLYDKTNTAVRLTIQSDADFCTESKTREIKADLTRYLAGDFSPPAKPIAAPKDPGLFGWLTPDKPEGREVINPNMWEDKRAPKTIRVPN
jgi:hypothetical protein